MTKIPLSRAAQVGIVGGGLAGLAAAAALIERGCQVEVFEARRRLGGRAGSYLDRDSGELVDHCQHVAMGCCTNFLGFCRDVGIADLFARHKDLHFFGEGGQQSDFSPTSWLPAPLHLAPALVGLNFLSLADKVGIARAIFRLMRTAVRDSTGGPTILQWLLQHGQSPRAIERFWQVVLVSALGESLDRSSLAAARKVFLDGFLAHADACHIWIPRVSLGELYDVRVAGWLRSRGATIHLETPVAAVEHDDGKVAVRFSDSSKQFDYVILAVPWRRVHELLSPAMRTVIDSQNAFASIEASPITGVHLWFDQPVTQLPHAVLIGRLSQWVFRRTITSNTTGHYYQVVISASRNLAGRDRQSVVDEVISDLSACFPLTRSAKLLRWQLITEQEAVFSVRPGLDAIRPAAQSAILKLLLAGDWTATGWPATMEGAVRSGYIAAEAILKQLHRPENVVVPGLRRSWLVRWFAGPADHS